MSRKRKRPNTLERLLKKGNLSFKKKKLDDALVSFDKAVKFAPDSVDAHFKRGEVYRYMKEKEKALQDFNKVVELDPNSAHIYIHRAWVYETLKKPDEALKDLKKAFRLDSTFELSYLINSGNVFSNQKKYDRALRFYDKALKRAPDKRTQGLIYSNIGRVYSRLDQHDKALEFYTKSLELCPENSRTMEAIGLTHNYLKQYETAREYLEKVALQWPDYFMGHINRGIFYRERSQFEKAIEAFRHAIALQPKATEGHFQLGMVYEQLRQYDKALQEYDYVSTVNTGFAHVYAHKGLVFACLFDYKKAIDNFTEAIKLDSQESVAYCSRAICHLELGDSNHALDDFQKAIELDSSFDYAYLGKGETLCFLTNEKTSFKAKKEHEREMLRCFEKARSSLDPKTQELGNWWIMFYKKYCSASSENRKRLRIFADIYDDALSSNLFSSIADERNRLGKLMILTKTIAKSECYFQILRRWNSFTPAIPERSRANLGGGYFFAYEGTGIIIDPGYNFIENFIENGLSLGDIDNIVLTHAHDDHTADFEAILSLFSKLTNVRGISLFANLGASVKFSNLIAKNESTIRDVEILNDSQEYQITKNLKMKATKAKHKDILTEATAKGLVFELKRGEKTYKLGITGDTMFFPETKQEAGLSSYFENADVLILHIGSIQKNELEFLEDNFDTHRYDGGHLGIRGVVNLILQCRPKLAIISEFGEELRELRAEIAHRIDNIFESYDSSDNVRVIPGDIGLKILFDGQISVKCEICGASINLKDIDYTETLINHKIAYHCKSHSRADVVKAFRKHEEKELRVQAESMGCSSDLVFRTPGFARYDDAMGD